MPGEVLIRRTADGWRVAGEDCADPIEAIVLADLVEPPAAPQPPAATPDAEHERLQATVAQLEHALTTRVTVEQAIGIITERHRVKPRRAFEMLRSAARSRGTRVRELAGDVVASATNPLLPLPAELSRAAGLTSGRTAGRRTRSR